MECLKSMFLLLTIINVIPTFAQDETVPPLNKHFEIKYFGKVTWFNAHLSCLACGSRLASIESEAEENHVLGLIRDLGLMHERFWIAGTDLANEGIFNWFTTGNLVAYSNFNSPQPDNANSSEHCLEYRAFTQDWNDWNCKNLGFFICESQPNYFLIFKSVEIDCKDCVSTTINSEHSKPYGLLKHKRFVK